MLLIKNTRELEIMREAGRISHHALMLAADYCKPGVTTKEMDTAIREYIQSHGAKPSFLNYNGFPASACISINNEVIHGIPSKKTILREGDIVSVDVGAFYKGFHGDNAYTFPVGTISEEDQKLLDTTKKSLEAGIAAARPGNRIGDVASAVQKIAEEQGYGVVRDFVGHGVGRNLHEEPEVPNFGNPGKGPRLVPGMVIAIEPMINGKGAAVQTLSDGWTVLTKSGSKSAHFENTVAITSDGPVILTRP